MSRPFWLRPLRLAEKTGESISKAAMHGEALELLLRKGALFLLEAANVDRAAVWANDGSGDPTWRGQVAQVDGPEPGTEACNVNAFEVFPVEFNEVNSPLEFVAPVFPAGPREFFEGISVAVGMPLKVDDHLLGAFMAGSARTGKLAGRELIEDVAAEIAISLYASRARAQQERLYRALHLREEIERLIARGAAAEGILRQILSALVKETGAQFAGVAQRLASSLKWEALSGSEPAEHLRQALFAVATSVFLERESIIRDVPHRSSPGLSIVGLPLDCSGHEALVLLACYRCGERLQLETLESFQAMITAISSPRQHQSELMLAEKIAAVGQLVSGTAHELNNPLTSIMGYAQLLLDKVGRRYHEAKLIFDEAERARRIVKNLLVLARPAAPEGVRTNVNEIIERTIGLRSYELKIHNIEVRSDLESQLPDTFADPHRIQQLVLNLLVNAEQAIGKDGGKSAIHVRTRRLSAGRLCIEISDTGPGVAPEIASRIFDPFFTTKPEGVGTGLGLAIVRSIAEQHGGKISFENLRQRGAKFTVVLPIVQVPAGGDARKQGSAAETVKSLPAARILIVEDEPAVAHLVADVLREDGHCVEVVLDSQEALARVMRSQYDLIICDLRMPRLDGPGFYDALVRARSSARHRVLFITGDTLGPHTLEFLQSHQLQYLAKPFLVEELKLAAHRVLERNPEHSSKAVGTGEE